MIKPDWATQSFAAGHVDPWSRWLTNSWTAWWFLSDWYAETKHEILRNVPNESSHLHATAQSYWNLGMITSAAYVWDHSELFVWFDRVAGNLDRWDRDMSQLWPSESYQAHNIAQRVKFRGSWSGRDSKTFGIVMSLPPWSWNWDRINISALNQRLHETQAEIFRNLSSSLTRCIILVFRHMLKSELRSSGQFNFAKQASPLRILFSWWKFIV
jgi:hypothetical protein